MVASVVLTLAASLPAWGSVAPSQNLTFRVSRTPIAWFRQAPGEMIRGSRQRVAQRVVIRSAPDRAPSRDERSDARTSIPVPPPSAHRALPKAPGAVLSTDDGSARRRPSTAWVSSTSARPGRVVQTRARKVAYAATTAAGASTFHEAHAPPLSSSFVGTRS